jgi:hypothetical protein
MSQILHQVKEGTMGKEHEYSAEELRELAAAVVDRILSDDTLAEALEEQVAKKKDPDDCPNGSLCCSKKHKCTDRFGCPVPFVCSNGHTESVLSRAFWEEANVDEERQGRDALDRLVADIARQIVEDPSVAEALAARSSGKKCPPGTLCCVRNYLCTPAFSCKPAFGCEDFFTFVSR